MRTPILDAIASLAQPLAITVSAPLLGADKEQLEIVLQDAFNAQFGNTEQSVEAIENIETALKETVKRTR